MSRRWTPPRRWVGLALLLLIGVGWFVVPGIWCALATVVVLGTNPVLDSREDRRYLRDARGDLADGDDR